MIALSFPNNKTTTLPIEVMGLCHILFHTLFYLDILYNQNKQISKLPLLNEIN